MGWVCGTSDILEKQLQLPAGTSEQHSIWFGLQQANLEKLTVKGHSHDGRRNIEESQVSML